ncbi:glycosyltransferase [Candidatus Albibeggiatoa sp. nov. NOAA]|uniref:glycosyltransferase n=1 Tax=Candidatus Albibeggiatoa sp. nov. NOAA TaxID=3162724 RepID=UPI00330001A1|nr:glycosyltransferase [Thiotrichaceae bacterium]
MQGNDLVLTNQQAQPPSYSLTSAGVEMYSGQIDIIVCVHNALTDVRLCLASILEHATGSYQLILVDDGSQSETAQFLQDFAEQHACQLLINEQARGYTCAANQGLKAASGDYVILLNSDTIVTPFWLDRLVACANSDEKIGMVGPLSNTASWQSVPYIEQNGDWATNPLPADMSPTQFANRLAAFSTRVYPRLPFLNGFCLLMKQAVIQQVGYFDEEAFGAGYGEENDYCIRARQAGWELAVADDTYIYHAQSKSYSHERRHQLAQRAGQALAEKHGQTIIDEGVEICRFSPALQGIRLRTQKLIERWNLIAQAQYRWQGKRIVFVLPLMEAGGGGNVVIFEARALKLMGIDVCILNFLHHKESFEQAYPNLDIPVIYSPTDFDIPHICKDFDVVIATANDSVEWIAPLADFSNPPKLAYYIQDFEPYFYVGRPTRKAWFWQSVWLRRRFASYYFRKREGFRRAWLSYLRVPNMLNFTKTKWNQNEVERQVKRRCAVIGASCDIDLFVPRSSKNEPSAPVVITAMIRPSSPRRGALRTMQVLKRIKQKYKDSVQILLFGTETDDARFLALPRDFGYKHLQILTSEQVADLLSLSDIFVDLSHFQAMGLTAMEAMASETAVIVPKTGGASSFATHRHNALIIDTFSTQACCDGLQFLIDNPAQRQRMAHQAQLDMLQFYPERAAYRLLEALFNC